MPNSLRFPRHEWPRLLPPEVHSPQAAVPERDLELWRDMRPDDLPGPLARARDGFLDAFRRGADTTDLETWGLGPDGSEAFLSMVARDPACVVAVVVVPEDPLREMGDYFTSLFRENAAILKTPILEGGDVRNKLVEAKTRQLTSARHLMELFMRARDARPGGAPLVGPPRAPTANAADLETEPLLGDPPKEAKFVEGLAEDDQP